MSELVLTRSCCVRISTDTILSCPNQYTDVNLDLGRYDTHLKGRLGDVNDLSQVVLRLPPGFRYEGLGFRFRVSVLGDLGFRYQGLGFGVCDRAGCRVQGAGCRVQGAGCREFGECDRRLRIAQVWSVRLIASTIMYRSVQFSI